MSPRRMDISSLLRDPSPPHDDPPRPHPASLLSILNATTSPPFLGLDALVHVASEERRRISAHDNDRPSRHYTYPLPSLHRPPDTPRPYKRPCPPSPPRSPSPRSNFPVPHQSASPSTNYPTLRHQLHMEPSRSINETRSIAHPPPLSLSHTSPFLHSLPPPQHSAHTSPRLSSPHRRSQYYPSSPIQSAPPMSALAELDVSPRYGHGPRMAGGIQVLSNDSSTRFDFPTYQSPARDLPTERLFSDSHPEHARYELSKLSPLSTRTFSPDDDRRQVRAMSHNLDDQDSGVSRERVRSHLTHVPLVAVTMDATRAMDKEVPFHPPPERHPIRVWEEQPTPSPRRVSPTRKPAVAPTFAQVSMWSGTSESRDSERPPTEGRAMTLPPSVVETVPSPLSTFKAPPPSPGLTTERFTRSQTPPESTLVDPRPSPVQSELQIHPAHTSPVTSAPASPVVDLHPVAQPPLELERSTTQVDAKTSAPPAFPDPIADKTDLVQAVMDAPASPVVELPQPAPELVPPAPLIEPETSVSTHSIHLSVSESASKSPSQQATPILSPTQDEHNPPLEETLTPPLTRPESTSRQSSEPEFIKEPGPPISEQAMMDVDEELLSLVEDRPVRAAPAIPKVPIDSKSLLQMAVGQATKQGSSEASGGPSVLSSQPVLKGLVIDEEKDRASMPPPAVRHRKAEKDKPTLAAATVTGSKKKKDGTSKPAAKPKHPPKSRAKPPPKPKAKPTIVDSSLKSSIPKSAVNANGRSRSTSVIPGAVDDVVPEPDVEDKDKEDDKLYCVCKTKYDEDRMMIACDRCDEWFHTLCVNMPDLEIDLVDQFICPPCMQKHPHLRTTWKRRCHFGLEHEDPSSPEACHKPSRGAYSKYCSDSCGIKYMQVRIERWEESGGVRDLLWESVKNATKREGVVVCAMTGVPGPKMDVDNDSPQSKPLNSAANRRAEREVTRLNTSLEEVVKERELMKRELDMVMWREKVVELASERAGNVDECGWDQRLCFGEEECADFGLEVLESYEERIKVESGDDAMSFDAVSATHGEWWCTGKKKCERHAGWQKLRAAEVSFDKETKEGILFKLTTREREIRKRIEDILYPQPTGTLQPASNTDVQLNGSEKTGLVSERGKKRLS